MTARPARLEDIALRPDPLAVEIEAGEARVIVTRQWFDTNEQQIRDLTTVLIDTERKTQDNLRVLLNSYEDAVFVREGTGPTDMEASIAVSFAKLLNDRNRKTRALAELCDLKRMKDAVGKTPEYEERQPRAWIEAFRAEKTNDRDDVIAEGQYIRQLQSENESLRGEIRHQHNEVDSRDKEIAGLNAEVFDLKGELFDATNKAKHLEGEVARLHAELNTPETSHFLDGVMREAAHQRQRWGNKHDDCKAPEDWLWLIGALAGKACRYFAMAKAFADLAATLRSDGAANGSVIAFVSDQARKAADKGLHHIITSAAAIANWHLNATGMDTRMRAGKPVEFQTDDEPEPIGDAKALAASVAP